MDWLKTNRITAAVIWVFSFVVYTLTVAPTVSYWDCGEFIAAAHTLGIPHPPGSPLYVMLGRLFSVLPIAADFAVRINLFSAFSSAIAAWSILSVSGIG